MNRKNILLAMLVLLLPLGGAFAQETPEATATGVDAIKTYLTTHGDDLLQHVIELQSDAQAYFDIIQSAQFDYQKAWDEHQAELTQLIQDARTQFMNTHTNGYELIEGIVAGVPSLADFDAWIDAAPPASEDPENAYDWTLTLDDGRTFEKPGNILHWVLETTLWGTDPDRTGLRVDLNGDGKDDVGDALPDAHFLLGGANAFIDAATQLNAAIADWTPSLEDSFTALATMVPTMGDYFQEWKNSTYFGGKDPRFVAESRLIDVIGIASSLNVIYTNVASDVETQDTTLDQQISAGFDDLLGFLDDTYQQEQDGKHFSAEQADALGEQAQSKADSLAALVGQAASLLNLSLPSFQ